MELNPKKMNNTTKTTAGGAAVGATIGSTVPGVGTVVGGLTGAAVGAGVDYVRKKMKKYRADMSWREYKPGAALGQYEELDGADLQGPEQLAQMDAPKNQRLAQARQLAARDYMTPLQKAMADAQANRGVQGQNIDQYEAQRALGRGAAMEGQYQSQKGTLDLANLDASRNQAFASRGRGLVGGSQAASEQATNQMQYGAALQNARLQAQLLGQGMQGQDIAQANQFRLQNQAVSPGEEAAYAAANQGLQDYQGQSQRQAGLLGNYYQQMYGAQGQAQGDYTQASLAQMQGGLGEYQQYLRQTMGDANTSSGALNKAYLQRTQQMSDLDKAMYSGKEIGDANIRAANDAYTGALYGMAGQAADAAASAGMMGMGGIGGMFGGMGAASAAAPAAGGISAGQVAAYNANPTSVYSPYGNWR